MSVFKVGKATITRIEETYLPIYTPAELFPAWTDAHLAEHGHWLVPNHYDPDSRKLKLSVHSWLLASRRPQDLDRRLLRQSQIPADAAVVEQCSIRRGSTGLPQPARARPRSIW